MRDSRKNTLRFEPKTPAETSGQAGPMSQKQTAVRQNRNAKPSADPMPPMGNSPGHSTSGQHGPKSGGNSKYRQHSKQARNSEQFHQEDVPPGTSSTSKKAAAREAQKLNKSKLCMEKSGKKLDAARDKLANQKPPKKPGPIKSTGKAAGRQTHRFIHGKIYQVEHENVGTEAAHRTELAGERVLRGGSRFIRQRFRTRPARQVRKWERKTVNAKANYAFEKLAQEKPELKKNALSRFYQKQRIKRQYQKKAKQAAKQGAKAAKRAAQETGKAVAFIFRHKKGIAIILIIALLLVVLMGAVSSCTMMFMDGVSAVMGTTYPSKESDILAVEAAYAGLEADLQNELDTIESTYPAYDEYRYDLAYIGHDPHQLAAYLSTVYQEYTLAEVQQGLNQVFDAQYILTLTEIVEVRYRTETHYDEYGNAYSVQVPYHYYILHVSLKNNGLAYVAESTLTAEQKQMYDIYRETLGNMPLLFGGGSIDGSPSTDLSGVVFVNGVRPGNQAIVDIAQSQVGNVGGYPYWSWYGFEGRVEWCACFVSWCYAQAGYSEPRFAACTSQGMPWFKSRGQWGDRSYADIAPGDAIFFDWDGDGTADHVGIVIGTDGTTVYTVEGNSGDACKIRSYSLDSGYIIGYGLMN